MTAGPYASNVQPIETRYAGCLFRSRLEARWAVFFDTLGVRWEYEPQGFVVAGRPYLPDFRLPDADTWVEVKGSESNLDEGSLRSFVAATRARLLVLGPVPQPVSDGEWCWTQLVAEPTEEPVLVDRPNWGGIEFEAVANMVSFGAWQTKGRLWLHYTEGWASPPWTNPYLDRDYGASCLAAYRAARSARFEHGQTR